MNSAEKEKEYLDVQGLAAKTGMSESWIYKAARRKEIPSFKMGRTVCFVWIEFEAWRKKKAGEQ